MEETSKFPFSFGKNKFMKGWRGKNEWKTKNVSKEEQAYEVINFPTCWQAKFRTLEALCWVENNVSKAQNLQN